MLDTSVIGAKYDAEAAPAPVAQRARWPIQWTIAFAVVVSLGLWALIFMGARAIWSVFA